MQRTIKAYASYYRLKADFNNAIGYKNFTNRTVTLPNGDVTFFVWISHDSDLDKVRGSEFTSAEFFGVTTYQQFIIQMRVKP